MVPPVTQHRLSLFGRSAAPFLVPAKTASASARSGRPGRPSGRRDLRASLDDREPGRTLRICRAPTEAPRAQRASVTRLLLLRLTAVSIAAAASPAWCRPADSGGVEAAIEEAARRFGLPPALIRAVVRAESDGRLDAVSPKGAMGLMQLMPATWGQMRAELSLGDDPFAPRDNVLAGAAYLRRLRDAYGAGGFLAAYNAGPGRYERYLAGTARLPAETARYVARVSGEVAGIGGTGRHTPSAWRWSPLFPGQAPDEAMADVSTSRAPSVFVVRRAEPRR